MMATAVASKLDYLEGDQTSCQCAIKVSFSVDTQNFPLQCQIVYQNEKQNWTWNLDLRHYDVVQDLYRLFLTVPDRIATAISILKEQELENGAFHIVQLKKSLRDYRQKFQNINVSPPSDDLTDRILFSYINGQQDETSAHQNRELKEILNDYLAKLETFEEFLRSKNLALVEKFGKDIVLQSENLTICCQVFIDLVYPVWRSIFRLGKWDEKNIACFCRRMRQKLVQ